MRLFTALTVALVLLFCMQASGQQTAQPEHRWRFSPLPVVYYSPETRLGFGVLLSANANFGDSLTTTSYFQSSFIYTLNKQYEWANTGRIYTKGNRHIIQYRIYHAYFPEYFYGYQTTQPENFKELIDYKRIWLELRKLWQVRKNFYAGIYGRLNHIYQVHSPENGSFEFVNPPGGSGYTITGLAPVFNYDSRDSQVYSRHGYYIELLWLKYGTHLSDFNFGNFRLDARAFKPVNLLHDDVLAFQLFVNLNNSTVPYKDMADIGGSYTMRGYYTGYYRYRNLYAFQCEYRFMINKYVGMVGWVGAATVSEIWNEPFIHSLKPNAGLGLRIRINQKDKLNLRADYGFGHHQQGLYFDAAEAF
jgi:hypothetical protein